MDLLTTDQVALRLVVALGLGALVGLERERKHRPAGFRTMILISLGSAGFVLIGHQSTAQMLAAYNNATTANGQPLISGPAEISRVLQGLIGGIGFLGAGAVIQSKKAVRGITTAAAVWVTAAVGAACGLGLMSMAAMLTAATMFTLVVLEWVENRWFPDPDDGQGWSLEKKNGKQHRGSGVSDETEDGEGVARLRGEEAAAGLSATRE